jgi:predicted RND superfamily exporter protein
LGDNLHVLLKKDKGRGVRKDIKGMVGVIGFIHFWGLTLSSVTMIHIIMCIGFCIDFSTHICHAFVQADGERNVRVSQALDLAGGPIFNGAISTIIGVLMLAFSTSYIFFSFFKVMFLVMVFGLIRVRVMLSLMKVFRSVRLIEKY